MVGERWAQVLVRIKSQQHRAHHAADVILPIHGRMRNSDRWPAATPLGARRRDSLVATPLAGGRWTGFSGGARVRRGAAGDALVPSDADAAAAPRNGNRTWVYKSSDVRSGDGILRCSIYM